MGGEDLIRAVRAERPGLPVVVVTGSTPPGGLEELRRGASGDGPLLLLLEPPCYAELASALRRAASADAVPRTPGGAAAYTPKAARRVDLAS